MESNHQTAGKPNKKKNKKIQLSSHFFFFFLFGVLRKPPSHRVWYWSSNSVLHSCCRWVVKNCESTDFTGSDPLRGRFQKTQVSFWAIKKKKKKIRPGGRCNISFGFSLFLFLWFSANLKKKSQNIQISLWTVRWTCPSQTHALLLSCCPLNILVVRLGVFHR